MGRTSDARERLIDAALDLIWNRGYHAVGVLDICEQAGVNKGSFYHFFASKQELVLDALSRYGAGVEAKFRAVAAMNAPPIEKLRHLFRTLAESMQACVQAGKPLPGCFLGNLAVELSTVDDRFRERIRATFQGWSESLREIVADARGGGVLPHLDPDAASRVLLAYLQGALVLAKASGDPAVIASLGDDFLLALAVDGSTDTRC